MAFDRKDSFYHKAKREGKRSRANYKIEEIDRRFRLFRPGQKILELGAAPGGWMEYIATRIGHQGRILGVDLQSIAGLKSPPCLTLAADICAPETTAAIEELLPPPYAGAVSDLAPNLTGIRATDQARAAALIDNAYRLARPRLIEGGFFVCKFFQGDELAGLQKRLQVDFSRLERAKPKASRKTSAEIYLVATGYRGNINPQ